MANEPLIVGARESPLSQAQFHEISASLPQTTLQPLFFKTTGDKDLKTSLRDLPKTDFFTKEIDQALLKGHCRVAVHSAKDLPDPLPKGLEMIALTRGVDASDSLVFKKTLQKGDLIATSSERREEAVNAWQSGFSFCDIRGTISARLAELERGKVQGVVIAEAALIRLGLTHLPRIALPGPSTPQQGQLAVIARSGDQAMKDLFAPLDVRTLPKGLYFTPHLPTNTFSKYWLHSCPLLHKKSYPALAVKEQWQQIHQATHLILTSKNSIRTLIEHFAELDLSLEILQTKRIIAVGSATAEAAKSLKPLSIDTALEETQEGLYAFLSQLPLEKAYILYPHSDLARPFLKDALMKYPHTAFPIYTMVKDPLTRLPDLNAYESALFTSPSTVKAFFELRPDIPSKLSLKAIGPVTEDALKAHHSILVRR